MITLLLLLPMLLCMAVVHESGHLLFARLFGVHVPQIQIGAGHWWWRGRIGRTQWTFGLLPIGGYTRVHGLAKKDAFVPVRGDYRLLHPMQQALVVLGGPLGNVALAMLLHGVLTVCDGASAGDTLVATLSAPVHILKSMVATWLDAFGIDAGIPPIAFLQHTLRSWCETLATGSVIVALLNLVPSPVTDGGKLVELIKGK